MTTMTIERDKTINIPVWLVSIIVPILLAGLSAYVITTNTYSSHKEKLYNHENRLNSIDSKINEIEEKKADITVLNLVLDKLNKIEDKIDQHITSER